MSPSRDPDLRSIAEAGYAALNAGDLGAALALMTEDVEFTSLVAEAEGTTYRGHDGFRTWWSTVYCEFDDPHWELLEIRDSGDRGIAHIRVSGVIGGARVEQPMWHVVRVRDGRLSWWKFTRTESEALEALDRA